MTIEIRMANNDDANEWDSIVSESPQGTIFHHWNWLKIAEKYTHSTLYTLIGVKGNTPVGIFPLFFKKMDLSEWFFPLHHAPPSFISGQF